MHEEGYPFLGGGLISAMAAAQDQGFIRQFNQLSLAESGDDPLRLRSEQRFDSIFHAPILPRGVGQRLSKWKI